MSRGLSAVALIAAYNEADIIEHVVRDLIANGVLVYLIDDGSTDDTVCRVEPFAGRGLIGIEHFSHPSNSNEFSLEHIVRRKAQLAADLEADWFINHDADEFRESPWSGAPLLDGIRRVDALGYNAIDFANFDFWPTHDGFQPGTDVRDAFPWYSEAASYNRIQIRCWRKTPNVELAQSGGHDVQFENRRVFPIRFISRHYPIRGQAHGERKVFVERRPRFAPGERARRWHVQYDGVEKGASFIRDTCELTRYNGDYVRTLLAIRHRGVEALEASLAESKSAAEAAKLETECTRCELRSAREAITRQAEQIVAMTDTAERERARIEQELESCRMERDELRETISALRTDLANARTTSTLRERDLASQSVELLSVRAALNEVRTTLNEIHRSWSWRITAPARIVLRRLRGY